MTAGPLYEQLLAACRLDGPYSAVRIRATYEPAAGVGSKLSPPTYPAENDRSSPYLVETRRVADGTRTAILLDSRQAQANHCEEALQSAIERGLIWIPHLVLETEAFGRPIRITSLTAPHRSRDAYFRDSAEATSGQRFDDTEPGQALAQCTPDDARALYRYAPTDLVYGVWDSHRGLRLAARFPRVYTSELVGWDPEEGVRAAGRFDLITSGQQRATVAGDRWQLDPKGKKKLSELGLGAIPPTTRTQRGSPVPGGVTVSGAERLAVLSFPAIARLRIGDDPEATAHGHAVLAALALLGDRLAFGRPGLFLRSGCDLVKVSEEISWIGSGGASAAIDLDRDAALRLLSHALAEAESAGISWHDRPIVLRPQPNLQQAIESAFFAGIAEQQEE